MLVIADTSPINYLVQIELIEILPKLYGNVVIPSEVRRELLAEEAPEVVRAWATALPDWIGVCDSNPELRDDPRWGFLDAGERSALALASERQPSLLLMDERVGTRIARAAGFAVTGTLGVLDEAARREIISLVSAIDGLKRTSFRYPRVVVEQSLAEDALRRLR